MTGQTSEKFGDDLKRRRTAAGMSKKLLADVCGLTRGTIRNLEEGAHLPSPDTMARLRKVKALRYAEADSPGTKRAETHLAPSYSPLRLAEELESAMRSSGATLDQALLYSEPQSVLDWIKYCSDANYLANYRDRIPVADVADIVAKLVTSSGVDVVALGSGDGRTEIRLVSHLLSATNQVVHLDLVDVSHHLLITAFRSACDTLAAHGVRVHPIHADFYDLRGYEPLTYRAPTDQRKRLWTLLGHTVGNLRDELLFLRDLAAISRPGDLLVLDFQTTPTVKEAEIRKSDRLLQGHFSELLLNWITGPLRRHLQLVEPPKITSWLNTHCTVPGSYAVTLTATLHKQEHGQVEFHLARFKRYEVSRFAAALADVGWKTLSTHSYGPPPPRCGLLLLERTDGGERDEGTRSEVQT